MRCNAKVEHKHGFDIKSRLRKPHSCGKFPAIQEVMYILQFSINQTFINQLYEQITLKPLKNQSKNFSDCNIEICTY